MPYLSQLDHLVLTVADTETTVTFYERVLGMRSEVFHAADGSRRVALTFGAQKINLHSASAPFDPKAAKPVPGSADLCFLSPVGLSKWRKHLANCGVPVIEGPVARTGATGPVLSIYLRDPDGNLIEVSNPA